MLSIGSYDILVLSLCCNDISNLTSTPINLHLFFAETSGLNTLHIAENALCRFPELKKVVILDAPPRIDSRSPRGPIVLPPVQWTRSLARKTRITDNSFKASKRCIKSGGLYWEQTNLTPLQNEPAKIGFILCMLNMQCLCTKNSLQAEAG